MLGPNGSGKTTVISLLTGLLTLQQGRLRVGGLNAPDEINNIKRLSALVPQDYAFYPALTARENLKIFAGLYQVPSNELPSRLEYCIGVSGLENVLDRRASEYSGGIKRRLNFALGLLNNPQILYLDEPTVGIDAQTRHFILEAIESLKNSGMTIVYTSHYMEEVEQICDEVAIIDRGRLLLQEPMSELLQGSRQLSVTPQEPPCASVLSVLSQSVKTDWDGSLLTLSPTSKQPLSHTLAALERAGVEVKQLHMGSNKLEEVYLTVTQAKLQN